MITFNDIFKTRFLNDIGAGDINIASAFIFACVLALYVFFVYRVVTKKTFYSKNFNISLAVIAIIVTSIILSIQHSIVISLGMVGALSIVRFRTAIKDPMDLVFLFWSIGIGIICGAGLYMLAVTTSVMVTIGVLALEKIPVAKAPYILVINASKTELEKVLLDKIGEYCKHYKVKSKTVSKAGLDIIVEIRAAKDDSLVQNLAAIENVLSVSLVSHDGEVTV